MKKKKNTNKMKFLDLVKSLRIPISKPSRAHKQKTKQQLLADIKLKEED